jgi:hypothetical protein
MNLLGVLVCALVVAVGCVLYKSKNDTTKELGRSMMVAGCIVGLWLAVPPWPRLR